MLIFWNAVSFHIVCGPIDGLWFAIWVDLWFYIRTPAQPTLSYMPRYNYITLQYITLHYTLSYMPRYNREQALRIY